jgi:outer membrane receptor for ferric coprogen and ferric-rhodotorulic acid
VHLFRLPPWPQESDTLQLDTITVSGERNEPSSESTESYAPDATSTSLKLDLSHRETPQSVSVITRQQIDDFHMTDVNDVLEGTTGVTVESVETDRTYYTSRGFDIVNFQYDGVGLPQTYDNVQGDMDTAFYDRVEVLRGANGLMTGTGNPSATVNFIRKRPTDDTRAALSVTGGSFDNRRIVGDLSGALTDSGHVRGRVVAGYQNRESHLDRYENEKQMFYGVMEADLTDTTLLTLGHATQTSDADSPLWGALPLFFSDGSPTDFKRSTSTASEWSFWDNTKHNTFVELQQELAGGWRAKATALRLELDSESGLFYQFGTPDPDTKLGLNPFPSDYQLNAEQWVFDTYASGPFSLLHRTHELVLGASWSRSEVEDRSLFTSESLPDLPPLADWTGDYPKPVFELAGGGSDWTDDETSTYAAARWSLTDRLTAITGLRLTWVDSEGESYGNTKKTRYDAEETPYAGLIFDLNRDHSVYGSYTRIFTPQTEVDRNRDRIEPLRGSNYELGLKSEYLNKRLISTAALFRIEQDNVAEAVGTFPDSTDSFYRTVDGITSEGVELELAGEVSDSVKLFAGYTYVDIEDADGGSAKPFIPEHMANLRGVWQVPGVTGLELGGQLRWQSDISQDQGLATTGPKAGEPIETEQDSYYLVDLMASYDFAPNWNATLNVNNVTDEKYLNSLKKFGASV